VHDGCPVEVDGLFAVRVPGVGEPMRGDPGDHGSGRRGERCGGGALRETGHSQPGGVAGQDEGGRGGGEAEQTTEQHRSGPDPVGQCAETASSSTSAPS
jgi:hypothetical protein